MLQKSFIPIANSFFFLAREHVRISRMYDEWNEKDRW
jgi:hypothetical protein